ncbi:MAG: hypothetical protein ABI743_04050 [bacterium]
MAEWYRDVFTHWSLALQMVAYVTVGLNVVAALWVFYDAQRYGSRLDPFGWACCGLVCAPLTLACYFWLTGSPRAGMAFGVTAVTALILVGMYNQPIEQAVDLQIGHTMSQMPVPGM